MIADLLWGMVILKASVKAETPPLEDEVEREELEEGGELILVRKPRKPNRKRKLRRKPQKRRRSKQGLDAWKKTKQLQ